MAADNTVKQSVSERLAGLKFMQRVKIRDDERKKQEAEELGSSTTGDSHWVTLGVTSGAENSRCRVIIEGNPPPAVMGRMSFGNCNPAVEKLMEEALARRNRMWNGARASNGKEEKRAVSTPQASANYVEPGNIEADDAEKISRRKKQKIVKVERQKLLLGRPALPQL